MRCKDLFNPQEKAPLTCLKEKSRSDIWCLKKCSLLGGKGRGGREGRRANGGKGRGWREGRRANGGNGRGGREGQRANRSTTKAFVCENKTSPK